MASFVHVAPGNAEDRIRRSGIKATRTADGVRGVHAMAVVADFMVTFQWARELARGQRRLVAVQFRIPDDQVVRFGHYSQTLMRPRLRRLSGRSARPTRRRGSRS